MRRRVNYTKPTHHSLIMFGLAIIIPLLAVANILFSAQVSHLGFRIAELNQQKGQLSQENAELEEQIFHQSALTKIQAIAVSRGYMSDADYFTLPGGYPVAYTNQAP